MNWGTLIALAITNGLPLALRLAEQWQRRDQLVTPEEIAELRALSQRTPQSQMAEALARAGIDPNSEQAKQLLALVQATPTAPPSLPGPS